jgi:hypothetical protein
MTELTKKEAIELSIKLWTYLRDNPHINRKCMIKESSLLHVLQMENKCPLCHYYSKYSDAGCSSRECPLYPCVGNDDEEVVGLYVYWTSSTSDTDRANYANEIVKQLEIGLKELQ